ncbi:hypothetical protein JNB85_20635 [Rhizobium mesosinicum]|uniref:Protein-tyrosine-phosphatase n=1 Tax=Rhizobium mesosinicum TaxID=335017 RepID=A0ABS7GXW5_9HYPH|nr:hypothetical protein [Rhizobium mesosinicum]MBW9054814.1 hypothetical protein [Rhizobium mesosinicum]
MTIDRIYNVLFLCTGNSARSVEGSEVEIGRAFAQAARFLKSRIMSFISLPIASIDKLALESLLRQIGTMDGASIKQPKAS